MEAAAAGRSLIVPGLSMLRQNQGSYGLWQRFWLMTLIWPASMIQSGRFMISARSLEREALKMADAKGLRNEMLQLDSDSPRYWEILEALNGLRNRKSQLS